MGAILEAIENNPKEIKRLLGIDQEQFRQLIAQTELLHKQKQEEIEIKKLRVNKKGGGKKPKLSLARANSLDFNIPTTARRALGVFRDV